MDTKHLPLWAQILLEDRRLQPRESEFRVNVEHLPHENEVIEVPSFRPARAGHSSDSCLVLMAHGSRDARWRGTFECLHASVKARYDDRIKLAYMEFVGPTLMDVARECHAEGTRHIRVLPMFMAGGAHVATDIPEQVGEVRAAFPAMRVEVAQPIGEDPRVFAVLQEIIGQHVEPGPTGTRIGAA